MKDGMDKQDKVVHVSFEVAMLLKGLHGLAEILGGVFLFIFNPQRLNGLMRLLTKGELSEDPGDRVAHLLLSLSAGLSISTHHFAVLYLISHGVIKCGLILLLWRKKLWAYPLTIISLVLFIGYQVYRFTLTHSLFLVFLTALDAVMIVLTYLEYKRIKASSEIHPDK